MAPLGRVMRSHLIEPCGFREQVQYPHMMKQHFDGQDARLGRFSERVRYLCLPRLMEVLNLADSDVQWRDTHELLGDRYSNR